MTLQDLARLHCAAEKNRLNLKGYIHERYSVRHQFFSLVATGRKRPSQKLIDSLILVHARLFPDRAVLLNIPGQPSMIIGDPRQLSKDSLSAG